MSSPKILFLISLLCLSSLLFSCSEKSTNPGDSGIYKIAFSWDVANNEQNDIYTVNPDGTELTRLTFASSTSSNGNPIWSPDGQYIYYKDFMDEANEIIRMNTDGTSKVNLTQYAGLDRLYDISSDGTKMLFLSDREQSTFNLFVMDLATQAITNVTDGQESIGVEAKFTPDGQRILFSTLAMSQYDLCFLSLDGTVRTLLSNLTYNDDFGVVSPNGQKIAYASKPESETYYEIWVCNIDGNNRVKISTSVEGNWGPCWSPNSQKVAFAEFINSDTSNIVVVNADGSEPVCLTDSSAVNYEPKWSPDGSKIAYISRTSVTSELFIMNSDGSGKTQLSNSLGNGYVYYLTWSPGL